MKWQSPNTLLVSFKESCESDTGSIGCMCELGAELISYKIHRNARKVCCQVSLDQDSAIGGSEADDI